MEWYDTIVKWLEGHMLTCPSKKMIQVDCPGCGLQRSGIALLKGDIVTSWHTYPPCMFIITTLFFMVLHLYFDFRHGAFILKCLYIVTVSVMITNYIYKIATNQLL